ncbi:MAG: hypothetical protein ACXVPK_08225 [Tumebacillaceae bacterium]
MVNWKKKLVIGLVGLSALVVPATVFASSYNITYNFDSNLTGPTRTFDGKNVAVDLHSSYSGPYPTSSIITVELYRHHTFTSDDFIGSDTAPSNGSKTIQWSNVGAGDYYLELHHDYWGWYVTGNGTIYNY